MNAIKSEKSKPLSKKGLLQFFGDEDTVLEGVQKKILNLAKKLCGKEKIESVDLISNSIKFPEINYCEVLIKLSNNKARKATIMEIAEYQVVNRDRFFINDIPLFFYVEHTGPFFDAKFSVTNNEWDNKPLNFDEYVEKAVNQTPEERLAEKLIEKGMNTIAPVPSVVPLATVPVTQPDQNVSPLTKHDPNNPTGVLRDLTKQSIGVKVARQPGRQNPANSFIQIADGASGGGANIDTTGMSPQEAAVHEISDDYLKNNESYTINGVNPRLQVIGDDNGVGMEGLEELDPTKDKCYF